MPLSPLFDALILLVFLAIKGVFMVLMVRILTGDENKINLLKAALVVLLLTVCGHFLGPLLGANLPESFQSRAPLFTAVVALALGTVLCRYVCGTAWVPGGMVIAVLIPIAIGMDAKALPKVREKLPEGPTLMQFLNLADEPYGEPGEEDEPEGSDPEAQVQGPKVEKFKSLRSDFAKGVDFGLERKKLMEALSPAEIQQYRDEMVRFMIEMDLATNMYALAALQEVDAEQVKALVAFLAEAKSQDALEQSGLPRRTIPESLDALRIDLFRIEFTEADEEMLQRIAALLAANAGKQAITEARETLESTRGTDRLAGAVLAALVQAETGMPAFQYFDNDTDEADQEKEPGGEAGEETDIETPDPSVLVPIPTSLGVVRIPKDKKIWKDWTDAANSLRIKGFLAQGDEIAIYLEDKTIFMPKDKWEVAHGVYTYTFVVDDIFKGMVYLSAGGRK